MFSQILFVLSVTLFLNVYSQDYGTISKPGYSCNDIKARLSNPTNGMYYINQLNNLGNLPVYCDLTDGDGWTLIHKLSSNVGGNAYTMWTNRSPLNEMDPTQMSPFKTSGHYLTDNFFSSSAWSKIKRFQVRLYSGSNVVKKLVYNNPSNIDANYASWFGAANFNAAQSNAWADMSLASSGNFYSFEGQQVNFRSWYINYDFNGCPGDRGWLMVSSSNSATCATFWNFNTIAPIQIMYSAGVNKTQFANVRNFADSFAIFAQFEEPDYGMAPSNPAISCSDLKIQRPSYPNGNYYVNVNGLTLTYCDLTSTSGNAWTLLHKLSAGVPAPGSPAQAYSLWNNRQPINEDSFTAATPFQTTNHYLTDNLFPAAQWSKIKQFSVRLYSGTTVVKNLVFTNPSGSSYDNWFKPGNYLPGQSNGWSDLTSTVFPVDGSGAPTIEGRFFALEGWAFDKRSWYINHNFGGCENDNGWVMVNSADETCNAFFGFNGRAPIRIIYSPLSTKCNWNTQRANADSIAIFVNLEQSDYGTSMSSPALSCNDIKAKNPSQTTSGIYYIGVLTPVPVYCDFSNGGSGWTLVHKISSGIGGDPELIWNSGAAINKFNYKQMSPFKTSDHYLLDNIYAQPQWLRIKQFSVRLYNGQNIVKNLVFDKPFFFNGYSKWFNSSNYNSTVSNGYTDFASFANGNYFSLEGVYSRNWYMSSAWGGKCDNNKGWLLLSNSASTSEDPCYNNFGFDSRPAIRIMYSGLSTMSTFSVNRNFADSFAIFVQLYDDVPIISTAYVTTKDISTGDITSKDLTTRARTTRSITTRDISTADITSRDLTTMSTTRDITTRDITTRDITSRDITTFTTTRDITSRDISTRMITTKALSTGRISTGITSKGVTTGITTQALTTDVPITTEEPEYDTTGVTTRPLTTGKLTTGKITTGAVTTGCYGPLCDCEGVLNGGKKYDYCGVCGGTNTTCCPPTKPYKCQDSGFCTDDTDTCSTTKAFTNCSTCAQVVCKAPKTLCASGDCVLGSDECPPIETCSAGLELCNDRSCLKNCTEANNRCPPATPFLVAGLCSSFPPVSSTGEVSVVATVTPTKSTIITLSANSSSANQAILPPVVSKSGSGNTGVTGQTSSTKKKSRQVTGNNFVVDFIVLLLSDGILQGDIYLSLDANINLTTQTDYNYFCLAEQINGTAIDQDSPDWQCIKRANIDYKTNSFNAYTDHWGIYSFFAGYEVTTQDITTQDISTGKPVTTKKEITTKALTTKLITTKDITTKDITTRRALTTDDITTKMITTGKPRGITTQMISTGITTKAIHTPITTKDITTKSVTTKKKSKWSDFS